MADAVVQGSLTMGVSTGTREDAEQFANDERVVEGMRQAASSHSQAPQVGSPGPRQF